MVKMLHLRTLQSKHRVVCQIWVEKEPNLVVWAVRDDQHLPRQMKCMFLERNDGIGRLDHLGFHLDRRIFF